MNASMNNPRVAEQPTGQEATPSTFLDMTRERWSVRKFAPEQISDEHMARILEAGRNAPSACNYQPQRILVLQSDEAIAKIRSLTHWADNARPSGWHFRRKDIDELCAFL